MQFRLNAHEQREIYQVMHTQEVAVIDDDSPALVHLLPIEIQQCPEEIMIYLQEVVILHHFCVAVYIPLPP